MRRSAVGACLLAWGLLGAASTAADAERRLAAPIVLVGLDGVDWQILDPLIEAGRTPHLARLKQRSAWAHLRSFEPILSPLLWTTIATGKSPDEHGIVDFLVADPATGRRVPITSRERKAQTLWQIFSGRGYSTDVVAWWASWPADRINGRMISDRVAYSLFEVDAPATGEAGLTHPAELWERIGSTVVSAEAVSYERVSRFIDVTPDEFAAARKRASEDPAEAYKEPTNHLTKILASTDTYHGIALTLLRERQPDLFAVYYQGVDEVCHRFAHFMPPRMEQVSPADFARYRRAVDEFYVHQDELLGELLAQVSPESIVLVLSDHGFFSGSSRPTDGPADIEGKPGKWHRLYGVLMIAGRGIPPGRVDTATLYDIAPTILALAGLPLAADMKGAPLLKPAGAGQLPSHVASYEPDAAPGPGWSGAGEAAAMDAPGAGTPSGVDEEVLRNLASLGYVGDVSNGDEAPAAAPRPGTVTAHTNLASVLLQNGDLAAAEAELRQALARHPGYVPALLTLGQVLGRLGRTAEALEAVRAAIERSPKVEDTAYLQLATLALRAEAAAETVALLNGLAGRRPDVAGIPTALGILALHAGANDAAEDHFRTALARQPTTPEALGQLFQMYRERGREAELEPTLREALRLDERSVLHHNWLGLILARRGDPAGAEAAFRRALDLAPDFGGTMVNLGSLYGRTGRLEEAVSILSRAVRIEPGNLEARVNLGAALAKLGRLEGAIQTLEEARRMGLRSTALLDAIGLAYAQRGENALAIEALRESLALSPDQPQVRSLLAELGAD